MITFWITSEMGRAIGPYCDHYISADGVTPILARSKPLTLGIDLNVKQLGYTKAPKARLIIAWGNAPEGKSRLFRGLKARFIFL